MSAALQTLIARSHAEREDWRYTDVEKLLGTAKAPMVAAVNDRARKLPCLINAASAHQRIVFMNGVWQQDESRLGDLHAALNGDATNGYRVDLKAQSCLVTAPLELMFMWEGVAESSAKLTINVGANTSMIIVEHHLSVGSEVLSHVVDIDIHLGNQSKLVHKKIMHDLNNSAHFARANVCVEAGAYYRNFALIKNTKVLRNEIDVTLAGSLAQCSLSAAMLLQKHEHADIKTQIHHAAPNGTSQQLFKAVIKEQARGVFQGRIKVAEGAQKTDGKQVCRALLLSDQAEMDAKPELEIYADDVACSHGCAIGDLDADAMFYLRSRGLNERQARALLLRAFVDEAIDTISDEQARSYVRELAERWMHD